MCLLSKLRFGCFFFVACLCLTVLCLFSIADENQPGEHHVELDGVNFWYAVEGHGPLLVIQAPGWGVGSSYLRNGLAPLAKKFTLIFYDTRGSGSSTKPSDESRMATSDMVDDLERLRVYWGLQRLDVLGHSHGGDIASNYASRYPDRVRRLVLVDSNISGYSDPTTEKILKDESTESRYKEAVEEYKKNWVPHTDTEFADILKRILPLYFYSPGGQAAFEATLSTLPSAWAIRTFSKAEEKHPLHENLSKVRAETLIVVGRADFVCPVTTAEKIHSEVKHSKLVVLERSGHFPWVERPEEFFKQVQKFLH